MASASGRHSFRKISPQQLDDIHPSPLCRTSMIYFAKSACCTCIKSEPGKFIQEGIAKSKFFKKLTIKIKAVLFEHAPDARDGVGAASFPGEKQRSAFRTTQEDADTDDSVSRFSYSGNRMAGEIEGGSEPWVPTTLPLIHERRFHFWSLKKGLSR